MTRGLAVLACLVAAGPAPAAETPLFTCANGVRASHSALNDRYRTQPPGGRDVLVGRPVGDRFTLLYDDARGEFVVLHASAGTTYVRQGETAGFSIGRTAGGAVSVEYELRPRTRLKAWHSLVYYVPVAGEARLLHVWRLLPLGEGGPGPAAGMETYDCRGFPDPQARLSKLPTID